MHNRIKTIAIVVLSTSGQALGGTGTSAVVSPPIPFRRAVSTPPEAVPAMPMLNPQPLPATLPPLTASQLRFAALNMAITSLGAVNPPDPENLPSFVVDRARLLQLGKALFWDQQLGSDGQACASCHFHAGADSRSKNQINPGMRSALVSGGDVTFGNSPLQPRSRPAFGPNYQLTTADFPLHRLSDPTKADSTLLSDTNDVISSQGSFAADFDWIGFPYDAGAPSVGTGLGAVFNVGGQLVRSVAPRNTPSAVNATFNHRNFWDSRARAEFNGVNPIGELDPTAQVVEVIRAGGSPLAVAHAIRIQGVSTASQADGPPLSDVEMSYASRRFAELGRKMLSGALMPLAMQRVSATDSVLGTLSRQALQPGAKGLMATYYDLVRAAFLAQWWDGGPWVVDLSSGSAQLVQGVNLGPDVFTVAEYNFSLFFGLAIREYERILIADDTPFDRFMEGNNAALTAQQLRGLQIFLGRGRCVGCHGGHELSNAGVTTVVRRGVLEILDGRPPVPDQLERMVMGDGSIAVYDTGHYNIGVRPTAEDVGLGGTIGPMNLPLSNSRRAQACVKQQVGSGVGVRAANDACGVVRILARPFEAERLLKTAAALLGNPPQVMSLLATADSLLGSNDSLTFSSPDLFAASMPLAQAVMILSILPGADRPAVKKLLDSATLLLPDPVDPGFDAQNPFAPPLGPDERVAVDGAFKTPGLRNVSLTAPYFHNGGQGTLAQVVDFYNRGGDFGPQNARDLDPDIQPLQLSVGDRADLVSFLQALTDERVRYERVPFDHPSLSVPNGGTPGRGTMAYFPGVAVLDDRFEIAEVGAAGSPAPLGTPKTPLANFPDPQQ